jgi:hypothetical protein
MVCHWRAVIICVLECRDNCWDSEFAKAMNLLNVTLTQIPHNALHSLQLSCDYQQVAACISVMGTK